MKLTDDMLQKIKHELSADPYALGYTSKTDQEVADLLNNSFDTETSEQAQKEPRIKELMRHIEREETPLTFNTLEVDAAKNVTLDTDFETKLAVKIKEELVNDPEKRGYEGKTDAEVETLLSEDYSVTVTTKTPQPSRINQLFVGIADAPNVITPEDVAAAKAL